MSLVPLANATCYYYFFLLFFLSGSFGPANGIGCQFHGYFVLYTDLSFKENLRDGDEEAGERIIAAAICARAYTI